MNQDEYVDLHALKNEVWPDKEVPEKLRFRGPRSASG